MYLSTIGLYFMLAFSFKHFLAMVLRINLNILAAYFGEQIGTNTPLVQAEGTEILCPPGPTTDFDVGTEKILRSPHISLFSLSFFRRPDLQKK